MKSVSRFYHEDVLVRIGLRCVSVLVGDMAFRWMETR
jgi:hypothetical protein